MQDTAVLGAGVIGASWASLFLAAGKNVAVYDPSETVEADVNAYIETAWPVLEQIGLAAPRRHGNLSFHRSAAEAVAEADFVQENVPERLEIKHGIYAEIEEALRSDAVVATSASGLLVREMQKGWKNPARFILGHPFNPPHLIPLVELLGNDQTAEGVLDLAEDFYTSVGKVTIRVQKEVPGHVANRLQAALWREAIHLVEIGAASVADVDKAIWAGPGLRWAAMGPHMLFNLAAGDGGMEEFCNRYSESFHRWWDDLGDTQLSPELAKKLADGATAEAGGKTLGELGAERDSLISGFLRSERGKR